MSKPRRPDLAARFRADIDGHVHGMMSTRRVPSLPADVLAVVGDVTDRTIVAVMKDGTAWTWTGGRYATRKVHLCYAPLMPKPEAGPIPAQRTPIEDVRSGAVILVNQRVQKVDRVVHATPEGAVVMVRLHHRSGAVILGAAPGELVTVVTPAPADAPAPLTVPEYDQERGRTGPAAEHVARALDPVRRSA